MTPEMKNALIGYEPCFNQRCRLEYLDSVITNLKTAIKLTVKNRQKAFDALDNCLVESVDGIMAESADNNGNGVEWPPA